MPNEKEEGKIKTTWTPEQKIQGFKELVTAILGVLVLACTLFLAGWTFYYVGDQSKITNAKDVLQILLGTAGVVIGYYFGRVPADARAAQAQEQANAATAQTEQVGAQTQAAADKVEQVMAKIAPTTAETRGISAGIDTAIGSDLQRIRDELRTLAAVSRRRG